jgi:uncharacterized protein YbjQ (UPF0145 family)
MNRIGVAALLLASAVALTPALADEPANASKPLINGEFGVPVFPYDITDRPYTVLGEVTAGVRKATVFSKAPNQAKIYRELWERGQKLGADAVIKANYGDPHITAFSWGSVKATGTAIKFTAPAPSAPASQPAQ